MALIKRVTVAGFRGIPSRLDVVFQNGGGPKSMILYGRNGTGKSSITDAWEWLTAAKIVHLAREGAEESSYPHMAAKPGATYVEVEFARPDLGTIRATFDPKHMRSPKITGDIKLLRSLVSHPCHVRFADLTRFVLLTKAERYDALATLMGFVPQMEYQKTLRRVSEKLAADLEGQRALYREANRRHELHFANKPKESFTPEQLLVQRFVAHGIACEPNLQAIAVAGTALKELVIVDKNAKALAAIRGMKASLAAFTPAATTSAKTKTLREAVGELKASQAVDREKILRIPFLQAATKLIGDLPPDGICPLCNEHFKGDLKEHVARELVTLQRLDTLLNRIRLAKDTLVVGLVDHSHETPVPVPENYAPAPALTQALADFQAKVTAWKSEYATIRGLLVFDTSALTDELIASLKSSESSVDLAHQAVHAAKRSVMAIFDATAESLERDPQRKKLVEDNEFVVKGVALIDEVKTSLEKGRLIRGINSRLNEVVEAYVALSLKDVTGRFEQISDKVTKFFALLEKDTPGLGAPKLKLDTNQDRSVVLEVIFQGTTISPAYKYLSESQLNSFGLAVSLASATHFNHDFPFLILDDVVNSCDAYKRPQLIELLLTQLGHVQVLLMTHDRFWRDLLHKRLTTWIRHDFLRYDLGTGPIHEPAKDTYDLIAEDLNRDRANVAATQFAHYLEDAAQEIGEALEIDVKFNRRGEYTLDPLLTAIRTRLEKKLGAEHPVVKEMLRITQDNAYRNWGTHCKNPESPITSVEVATVVANWKAVEQKFYCPTCKGIVKSHDNKFHCDCGATVLARAVV